MPRYRLTAENGDDLGPFQAATPTWQAGDLIYRGSQSTLEIVRVVPAEHDDEVVGYLIVRMKE